MIEIRKGTLDKYAPKQDVLLPEDTRFLAIGSQFEEIVFWYECGVKSDLRAIEFISFNDGDDAPLDHNYLGTVILHGGVYVRHIYIKQCPKP